MSGMLTEAVSRLPDLTPHERTVLLVLADYAKNDSKRCWPGIKRTPLFSPSDEGAAPERCLVARELVRRWLGEQLENGPILSSPTTVRDFLRVYFANQQHESFVSLYLDAQHKLIVTEESFRGTLTQTAVYPREIVRAALRHNAAAVIFSHNHPSGVAEPSRADEALTNALKQALVLVDVKVLDHFVIGASSVLSFAERGLL